MKLLNCIFTVCLLLCMACSKKQNNQPTLNEIGKYVYIDDNSIVHITDNCIKLKLGKDKHGHSIYGKEVVDTSDFVFAGRIRLCVRCVDDLDYEHLLDISNRNKECEIYRKWIRDKLFRAGYELEPYELFVKHISNPIRREELYVTACNEGWEVGTYEEFSRLLGFGSDK